MKFRSVGDVFESYEAGDMARGELPGHVMEFVDETNVDEVVDLLPDAYRETFLEWAAGNYLRDYNWIHINAEPLPERSIRGIRAWFTRHRPEAFAAAPPVT